MSNQLGAAGVDGQFGHVNFYLLPCIVSLDSNRCTAVITHQDDDSTSDFLKNNLKMHF